MNYWRMSFRLGTGGEDVWEYCFERGVAAIGYYHSSSKPVFGDCSKMTLQEFGDLCRQVGPVPSAIQYSMRCLTYEVKPGDIIYARSSPWIVAKGVVTTAYRYDPKIMAGTPARWEHFVRVRWEKLPPFRLPIPPHQYALWKLEGYRLKMMQKAEATARKQAGV